MLKHWLLAARPKTLTAALVPIVASTGLVVALGHQVQGWITLFALLASLFIQVGTNYVNDALDFKKGADTETRLGPKRVTATGVFSYRQVMVAAVLCFAMAILLGLPLVLQGGWPIFLIGILSLIFGYAYTAGPFPLAYLGLGDFFVILFFGWIAVGGLWFLHTGTWSFEAFVLGTQVGFHCNILLAINNLRDVNQDVLVNKKTLAVRFGKKFARLEIAILSFVPFFLNFYWYSKGLLWAAILPALALPIAIRLCYKVFSTEPSAEYNRFLGMGAGLHLLFGILLSIGFFV
jgi:1,4-dihydroxy-2-naphthoate octaprenyltransferase